MTDVREIFNAFDSHDDGYFLIENRENTAYLCVFPPTTKMGRKVTLSEVQARLELFEISYDIEQVKTIVERADGKWHALGNWKEPESEDAKWEILISEDKKSAYLKITPPVYKGKWINSEEIWKALREKGIIIGIQEELLEKIINRELEELKDFTQNETWEKTFLIAKAIDPQQSTDGKIRFYFDPFPRAKPKENPNGKVDLRALNVIQVCKEKDLLAEILPPIKGKPGVDIFGNPIPPIEGKCAQIEAGENTELIDGKLYAKIAGQVKIQTNSDFTHAKIQVIPVLTLENVDFSVGNIEFPGTVYIKNRILDGFEVKAGEDIIIEKSVGSVKLSSQGDIILHGGIMGRGQGFVYAEGNIYARFIQNSQVYAKKSVYVEDLIFHSEVLAGEEIHIHQGRGELIGGKSICGQKLISKRIGAVAEPHTLIYVGIPPETLKEINKINEEIERNSRLLAEIEKNIKYLENQPAKLQEEKHKRYYEKLKLAKQKLQQKQENYLNQKEILLLSSKAQPQGEVHIQEIIFPNVEIIFGNKSAKYKQTKTPIKFSCKIAYDTKNRVPKILYD
ncbi:MAG: FapA family protein [Leptospiraceae bacterium]|nr:FapA family protein [Leptospiraceae bacterium]